MQVGACNRFYPNRKYPPSVGKKGNFIFWRGIQPIKQGSKQVLALGVDIRMKDEKFGFPKRHHSIVTLLRHVNRNWTAWYRCLHISNKLYMLFLLKTKSTMLSWAHIDVYHNFSILLWKIQMRFGPKKKHHRPSWWCKFCSILNNSFGILFKQKQNPILSMFLLEIIYFLRKKYIWKKQNPIIIGFMEISSRRHKEHCCGKILDSKFQIQNLHYFWGTDSFWKGCRIVLLFA